MWVCVWVCIKKVRTSNFEALGNGLNGLLLGPTINPAEKPKAKLESKRRLIDLNRTPKGLSI